MGGGAVVVGAGVAVVLVSVWFGRITRWLSGFPRTERGFKVGVWWIRACGAALVAIGLANLSRTQLRGTEVDDRRDEVDAAF